MRKRRWFPLTIRTVPFMKPWRKALAGVKPRRAALRATTRRLILCLRNIRQKNNVSYVTDSLALGRSMSNPSRKSYFP